MPLIDLTASTDSEPCDRLESDSNSDREVVYLGTEPGAAKTEPSDRFDGDSGSSDNSNSEGTKQLMTHCPILRAGSSFNNYYR